MKKSKIMKQVMNGLTSSQKGKVKEGVKTVVAKKDMLMWTLNNGPDLSKDAGDVILTCMKFREKSIELNDGVSISACYGCPFCQEMKEGPYNFHNKVFGCMFRDRWQKRAEGLIPEEINTMIDGAENGEPLQ